MSAKKNKQDDRSQETMKQANTGEETEMSPDGETAADTEGSEGESGFIDGEGIEENGEAEQEDAGQIKDQLLRLTADFDNFRKRTSRDKEDWSRYASQSIIEKLIPVMDSMDAAALAVANAGQEAKSVSEGILMIYKQLTDILSREGLAEIQAIGEMFDPNIHEAVMTVAGEEGQKDNEVVAVLRKGYMFKDKVLRPVMVQVAKD